MLAVEIQDDLAILQRSLEEYAQLSGKTSAEVLEKKGRDLSIELFDQFRKRQWGGAVRKGGLARAEMLARRAAGEGTTVREQLREVFEKSKAQLTSDVRSAGQYRRRARELGGAGIGVYVAAAKAGLAARRRRAGLWNRIVTEELRYRQKGIGVLAAGWLAFRKRESKSRGEYFVRNRTGKPLGSVEIGDGFVRMGNLVRGVDLVAGKYNLLSASIGRIVADIAVYTNQKHIEKFQQAFRRLAAAA